jgi:hypothetical protein
MAATSPSRPFPDMVQGIHLVAPGGVEFFIQRGGVAAIVDTNLLGQLMPCVAGRIISNNEVFNAVLVSLGRMGIIYSMVVEVESQFILEEICVQADWGSVSSNILLETAGGPPSSSGGPDGVWTLEQRHEVREIR